MTPGYFPIVCLPHPACCKVSERRGEHRAEARLVHFPAGGIFGWARGWCSCLYRSGPRERGRKGLNQEPVQEHRKESQRDRKRLWLSCTLFVSEIKRLRPGEILGLSFRMGGHSTTVSSKITKDLVQHSWISKVDEA